MLFRTAADPRSPLNPFSTESEAVREQAIDLFRQVVDGAADPVPDDLRPELPRLLWTWHMGVILFWIHDFSPDHARTRLLAERTAGMISQAIGLAALPGLEPALRAVLDLIAEVVPRPLDPLNSTSAPTP